MYLRGERIAGKTKEVHKRFVYQCEMKDGKPVRCRRKEKINPTPEAMRKYNQQLRERKFIRKANANFGKGDLYLTLTYPRECRPTPEKARRNLKNFQDCLRRRYRKAGKELKWMACTEIGSRGGIHHHMLVNEYDDIRGISDLWERYGGYAHIQFVRGNNLAKLASYIAKSEYSCSRNLIDPPEKTKKVKANSWRDDPVVPRGWMLDKDSLVTGINPVTGHGYQFYRLVQLE